MRTKVLFAASILLLIATAFVVTTYGQTVYFVAFHKPLHITLSSYSAQFVTPSTPSFKVHPSIATSLLNPGMTQTIMITAEPDSSLSAYIEVWVEGPMHTQVFRNSIDGTPTTFVKGQPQSFAYQYRLPLNLPKGIYTVSAILTSVNNQTDYYVRTNFATFTVT